LPRGECWPRATTMALIIRAADPSLKIQADAVHTFTRDSKHGYIAVTINGRTAAYDPTWGMKLDTRDADVAALWVLAFSRSTRTVAPYKMINLAKYASMGDPVSTLPPAQFGRSPHPDFRGVPKSYDPPNINPY
jgi:hypothetical protein